MISLRVQLEWRTVDRFSWFVPGIFCNLSPLNVYPCLDVLHTPRLVFLDSLFRFRRQFQAKTCRNEWYWENECCCCKPHRHFKKFVPVCSVFLHLFSLSHSLSHVLKLRSRHFLLRRHWILLLILFSKRPLYWTVVLNGRTPIVVTYTSPLIVYKCRFVSLASMTRVLIEKRIGHIHTSFTVDIIYICIRSETCVAVYNVTW